MIEDFAAVLGIGIIAEIRPFIHKPLAFNVHDEAKRIRMLLEQLGHRAVPGWRGIEIPGHGVAAAPVPVGLRPDLQRHIDAIARVVGNAAHLGQFPALAEIAGAHFRIRFKAATSQYHGLGVQVFKPLRPLDFNPRHPAGLILNQLDPLGFVADFHAHALADFKLLIRQALASPHRLDEQATPEVKLVAALKRLAAKRQHKPHAVLAQPLQRRMGLRHQHLRQIRIGQALRHPHQVIVKLILGIGAHLH